MPVEFDKIPNRHIALCSRPEPAHPEILGALDRVFKSLASNADRRVDSDTVEEIGDRSGGHHFRSTLALNPRARDA